MSVARGRVGREPAGDGEDALEPRANHDPASVAPLRIGILGAARITELSLVQPARALGHRLVAVAARDPARAREFADRHGVERVHHTYQDVVDDPDLDVVYNPLPNSLHAKWNLRAVGAGKHLLAEKPFAPDAALAREVAEAARASGAVVLEAFHYPFHPLWHRVTAIIEAGEIGVVQRVETMLWMPAPPANDPRWSLELSGGALMDLGCYALHAQRQLGLRFLGGEPTLISAAARERDGRPGVDAAMHCELRFPDGTIGVAGCDMEAEDEVDFHLTVTGSTGEVRVPDFPRPHEDDRLFVRRGALESEERLGTTSSYTYQLEAFASAVRTTAALPYDAADTVPQADLIERAYAAAGVRR